MINEKELMNSEYEEKISRDLFKLGIIGAGYFSARYFLGPEINLETGGIPTAWQVLDTINLVATGIGILGGIGWGTNYYIRKFYEKGLKKIHEKGLKKTKQNLEEISEEDKEI